ncbi:protein-L-isoaspartate O-methyltransferase [Rhodopseudomonas palustris]|uniref:Protein-L-isoaspartate O-methyltransferase n=1 Tax=Rhodopseudomonas palustris TaxID=1076 RepID=A0A323UGK3_RHOPL|nr:protein-L-isoaspartate(D-aspartate) O-methyltransferase [Rhodopseudomonas palustris]PZA11581.1 protein-L-isoaspartate O-methyltransferase [Rhodopseudomonas palustris]
MTSPASDPPPLSGRSFAVLRELMVERQIVARGIRDPLVLAAMRKVPREVFLPESKRDLAYEDAPVPIAAEQTMSQPYIVALMAEALLLQGGDNVLEVGAGSGYAAAVLGEIAGHVTTVERIAALADAAAAKLAELGYRNIDLQQGDGTRGWPQAAPYDAIVVAAAGPQVPESLKAQLKIGGRLVMPVGADQHAQELVRLTRLGPADFTREHLDDVRFVPLLGAEGWPSPEPAGRSARDGR